MITIRINVFNSGRHQFLAILLMREVKKSHDNENFCETSKSINEVCFSGELRLRPTNMKLWIVGTFFIALMILSGLSAYVESDMQQTKLDGTAGPITSDSFYDISMKKSDGKYVRYDLTVKINHTVDVYLMSKDDFYEMRENRSFDYINVDFNIHHVKEESKIEGNGSSYILVSSTSSNDSVPTMIPVSWTVQQSHYELIYYDIASIMRIPLMILTTLIFLYLIKIYMDRKKKNET